MQMGLSHVRHTYFMTGKFTKSILHEESVGQTVPKSQLLKGKYCKMMTIQITSWFWWRQERKELKMSHLQ